MLSSNDLRSKYLTFFSERGHRVIPSASLVPTNDPTVLFTTAGMHPLVPYLLGEPHSSGKRLVNAQRCVRTGDIDLIGDDTHLTFFEMLGNWSLGDYFRDDSIRWSFEFLTKTLHLPLDRLGVTCFGGDDVVPRDDEASDRWRELGLPQSRIQFLGREDNWWGPAGKTGPCGPDTEIFYWIDSNSPPPSSSDVIDVRSDPRWVEIWNNVFMDHNKRNDGAITSLDRKNVDTGMGLERTLVAINGFRSVYEVDTIAPLYEEMSRDRVLTDHLRAACLMISDGVVPTNKDRGYVLRRLLRRSSLRARRLNLVETQWHRRGLSVLIRCLGGEYPLLRENEQLIDETIRDELVRFDQTLAQGVRVVEKLKKIDGRAAFDLFQTYGFPFELTCELAKEQSKEIVDREGYLEELERHREASRLSSSDGETFQGGLADHHSEEVVRYHTLTHLLQSALRKVLGDHVIQRGSNITQARLRFDFSHDRKLSPTEVERVESIVNGWLQRQSTLEIVRAVMSEREARALGAIGAFGEKYGESVSVYSIIDRESGEVLSREFCGGPHIASFGEGRRFRITKEQAISSGVRRIKASLVS